MTSITPARVGMSGAEKGLNLGEQIRQVERLGEEGHALRDRTMPGVLLVREPGDEQDRQARAERRACRIRSVP